MWELGSPRNGSCSLKERLARSTVNRLRSQGHPYVELREEGKRFVFFCTLCLAPCYNDGVLLDHLKGALHNRRLSAAKLTLLKSKPWPFSDGVNFFDCSADAAENKNKLPTDTSDDARLAVQLVDGNSNAVVECPGNVVGLLHKTGEIYDLVIPTVLIKEEMSNLKVRFVGLGKIAARFQEKDDCATELQRLWCEWLGDYGDLELDESKAVDHDYAVVTFPYNYQLGNGDLNNDYTFSKNIRFEIENEEKGVKKRRQSSSDPGHSDDSVGYRYDSSGEDSSSSVGACLTVDRFDDQFCHSRFITSKNLRHELRRQQRLAAERMCDICQQKMLPHKDVAAILNMKTGKLVCSSRNGNGAFHVFHVSCLIHWILLCESEMIRNQLSSPKPKRKRRKNGTAKCTGMVKGKKAPVVKSQIDHVFCPECQGTGLIIDGDEFEIPNFPLSEIFKFKIRMSDGRRGWMKSPEVLENCSTGFHFVTQSIGEVQEKVVPLKFLHFYRAVGL